MAMRLRFGVRQPGTAAVVSVHIDDHAHRDVEPVIVRYGFPRMPVEAT